MKHFLSKTALRVKSCRGIYVFLFFLSFAAIQLFSFRVLAEGRRQYSFSFQKKTLRESFNLIEKNSDYRFFYRTAEVDDNQVISATVKNAEIEELLDKVLQKTGLTFSISEKLIIVKKLPKAPAVKPSQDKKVKVTGRVTDEQGEPLISLNLFIKGTTSGTATDFNGRFSIEVLPEDILVFSYIGYVKQEIAVGNQTMIDVVMKADVTQLEEVVTIGYGVQKKKDLTGSVAQVKGEDLVKDVGTSLTHSLAGKLAGVYTVQSNGQPGVDAGSFFIRSFGTLRTNGDKTNKANAPLVLVDGVQRPWSRINPNDIQDFVVLKDASSTAIYGSRGANGVVLITTKRGKSGKAEISYTGTYSIQKVTQEPEMMNAYEYAVNYNQARKNDGDDPFYTAEEIEKYRIKEKGYEGTDWWGEVMEDSAPMHKHELSISGGTEKIQYYVSGDFMDQEGLLRTTGFKKYSMRSNVDAQVTDNFKLSVDMAFRQENRNEPNSTHHWYNMMESVPTFPAYVSFVQGDTVVENGLGYNGFNSNPIGFAYHSGNREFKKSIYNTGVNATLKIPSVKGLTLKGRLSFDKEYFDRTYFNTPFRYWILDRKSGKYTSPPAEGTMNLSRYKSEKQYLTFLGSVNYARSFGKHNLNVLALAEGSEEKWHELEGYREAFISKEVQQLYAGGDEVQKANGKASVKAMVGFAGRVSYDYAGKYLLQANVRYDGSYNFKDRWGLFPAASVGWRVSEESFFKDQVSLISNLKLRLSYGQSGNDKVPPYQFLSGFEFYKGHVFGDGFNKGIRPKAVPNPDITWETSTDANIGVDFGILEDRISGTFDYYTRRTKDILYPRSASVPGTFGAALPHENFGIMDSKGVEVVLNYKDDWNGLHWNLGTTFSYATNEIIEIDEPADVSDLMKKEGRAYGTRFGYLSNGLFQSQEEIDSWAIQDNNDNSSLQPGDIRYVDISGPEGVPDGKIDGDDRTVIGKVAQPEIIYGINFSLSYKGFGLTTNWQGAANYEKQHRLASFINNGNNIKELNDSWSPENRDAKYPRLGVGMPVNNDKNTDFWMVDASYLRLKNLTFEYNLNSSKLQNYLNISSVRFFFTGTNLLTFSAVDYLDPDGPANPTPFYPVMKSYSMGVNIIF